MDRFETTSPDTRRKSPAITARLSRSRKKSPTELDDVLSKARVRKGEEDSLHFDELYVEGLVSRESIKDKIKGLQTLCSFQLVRCENRNKGLHPERPSWQETPGYIQLTAYLREGEDTVKGRQTLDIRI